MLLFYLFFWKRKLGLALELPRRALMVVGLMKSIFFPGKTSILMLSENNHLSTWHNKYLKDILFYESIFFFLL